MKVRKRRKDTGKLGIAVVVQLYLITMTVTRTQKYTFVVENAVGRVDLEKYASLWDNRTRLQRIRSRKALPLVGVQRPPFTVPLSPIYTS